MIGNAIRQAELASIAMLLGSGEAMAQAAAPAPPPSLSTAAPLAMPAAAPSTPDDCRPVGFYTGPPEFKSVEQLPDGRVSFRLCAPDATKVLVVSSDMDPIIPLSFMPGPGGLPLAKDKRGLWSGTTEKPVAADTYRFNFLVDGAEVPDPQATHFSEERIGVNSVLEVTGSEGDFQTYAKEIPHGTVGEIEYWSTALGAKRRAHVYTPPGYMKDAQSYPVLYLVHGAGDSDDSWTSVGHAHYIIDRLIAAGKAKQMIVVMPAGHTPPRAQADILYNQDFGDDLIKDLIPYIEANYRTINTADARAMAGLSMGGAHTLNFGLTHSELFHAIGIFSMGLGMNDEQQQIANYRMRNEAALKRAAIELKLVYYAMGKDDFLYGTVKPTRALFDAYGIRHVFHESGGGHTWVNWRRYLADFAPRLFQ